ncbi:Kinesin, putative [Hondaea fermentalgiana]|uniref:Kinesin, putative n=1 Tax=Hondaea fermentalgiana TaxID=2315210 RepID=A0A2R5GJ51_9STRA|nr:Kinesin, putative [Hondaea fermentalgiana]|eukprot:GBG30645.1 Kinesin, putative [Hondaea fermentalgiana]
MPGLFGTPGRSKLQQQQQVTPHQDDVKAFQNRVLLERFNMVIEFMNVKLGEDWNGDTVVEKPQDLLQGLKDGSVLCKLVGLSPAQTGSDEERTKSNLHQFRREATRLGLPETSLFSAGDLLQPSSLSAICVVNCLQELRIKLLEMDRALLNEHYSSPSRETRHRLTNSNQMLVRPVDAARDGSPMTRPASRGVLDLLGGDQGAAPLTPQQQLMRGADAGGSGGSSSKASSSKRSGRRVSINTLNTQASLARVQERMASTYKDKCKQLEAGNQELVEAVEDLQDTVASLQRSKHGYQLECEKLQDRNRVMLTHFRLMEAQIKACTEAWRSCNVSTEEHPTLREVDEEMNTLKMTWDDVNEATEAVQKEAALGVAEQDRRAIEESIEEGDEGDEDEGEGARVAPADAPPQVKKADASSSPEVDDLCEKLFTLNISKEEYQETKAELSRTKDILRKTKDHVFALQKELQMEKDAHAEAVKQLRDKLSTLKFEFADLSNDFRGAFSNSAASFAAMAKTLQTRVSECDARRKDAQARFSKEEKRRKQLLNMVHNLKGNIRVMCRVRPVLSSDLEKEDSNVAIEPIDDERLTIATSATSAAGTVSTKTSEYEFDRVFGPTSSQESVFDEVSPLVESVMDGFHSCIFAYGQTGSGKTYTMSGGDGPENRGINYLALEELFRANAQRRAGGAHYRFKVQNVEIYCEKVIDLLASHPDQSDVVAEEKGGSNGPAYLEIRASDRDGVHMPGCVEIEVKSVEEVIEVMELGARNRSSAHTKMNMASSRSHSVVIVSVHGANDETGRSTFGKLVLVDLAGSERLAKSGVKGVQLKEAQAINKSLSCLGDVISALESKAAHVPFRNSKLTTLLQDSLGKDNKALMILQVSPTTFNVQESTCSLNFAARVRQCELGKAKKKERVGESSKQRAAMKQAQDRTHQLELKIKMLNKKLEEARIEQDTIRAQAAKDAEKITKRYEDRFVSLKESDGKEIKALRDKLQDRQSESSGQVAKLEADLHAAKMEVANLRQQLRSSIAGPSSVAAVAPPPMPAAPTVAAMASPSPSPVGKNAARRASLEGVRSRAARSTTATSTSTTVAKSRSVAAVKSTPPRTATSVASPVARSVASQDNSLRERRTSLDNIQANVSSPEPNDAAKDQAKKQVSWKNTPQVIPPSDKKAARQRVASEDENDSPDKNSQRVPATIRLANTATVASKARAATSVPREYDVPEVI